MAMMKIHSMHSQVIHPKKNRLESVCTYTCEPGKDLLETTSEHTCWALRQQKESVPTRMNHSWYWCRHPGFFKNESL